MTCTSKHKRGHSPIQYERPFGLWMAVSCGSVTHHSYQTLFSFDTLQKWTSTHEEAGTYMGSCKCQSWKHIICWSYLWGQFQHGYST